METLIVKVDNKKNLDYLKELLLKLNFVLEIDSPPSVEGEKTGKSQSVAGMLNAYADAKKVKEEKAIWESVVKQKHGVYC